MTRHTHLGNYHHWQSWLVRWCFELSPPQRITLGLKRNFSLSSSYSFRRSLYNKSLFLKPQCNYIPNFRIQTHKNNYTCFGACLHSWALKMGTSINCVKDEQDDLFYSAGSHRNQCKSQPTQEKVGRGCGKSAVEWTGRVEISKEEIPGSKHSMYDYLLTYSMF